MKIWYRPNLALPSKAWLASWTCWLLVSFVGSPLLAAPAAAAAGKDVGHEVVMWPESKPAYDDPERRPTWLSFQEIMLRQRERERMEGFSYLVSGTLILLGAEVGYRDSRDDLQKFAYSFAQSLAVGAMGYGYYLYARGSQVNDVYEMLDRTPGLSLQQREDMLRIYLQRQHERRHNERWIRAISHGLIAAINLSRAHQTEDSELKNALYVLGGLNAIAAVSISF